MSFQINYKGTSCRGTTFLYICGKCNHEQQAVHTAAETPIVACTECHYSMNKKPTTVNLDADQHMDSMSWNRGWDYDESKE